MGMVAFNIRSERDFSDEKRARPVLKAVSVCYMGKQLHDGLELKLKAAERITLRIEPI